MFQEGIVVPGQQRDRVLWGLRRDLAVNRYLDLFVTRLDTICCILGNTVPISDLATGVTSVFPEFTIENSHPYAGGYDKAQE